MNDETFCQWLRRKHPDEWVRAAQTIKRLPDFPIAKWRWDFLRLSHDFRHDCDSIREKRKVEAKHRIDGFRSVADKKKSWDVYPGDIISCRDDIKKLCAKWELSAPHPDGELLFLDYGIDFGTLITGLVASCILNRMEVSFGRWAEDFGQPGGGIFSGFFTSKIMESHGENTQEGTKFSCFLEVHYHRLSTVQFKKIIGVFRGAESIHCFQLITKKISNGHRSLLLKIATPQFPMPEVGTDAAEIAKPLLMRVQALTAEALGVELPTAAPRIHNRPEANEKQILALAGDSNEYRPRMQARIKMREVERNAKQREKLINPI